MSYTAGPGITISSMWITGALVLSSSPLLTGLVWGFAAVLTVVYVVDDFSINEKYAGKKKNW